MERGGRFSSGATVGRLRDDRDGNSGGGGGGDALHKPEHLDYPDACAFEPGLLTASALSHTRSSVMLLKPRTPEIPAAAS